MKQNGFGVWLPPFLGFLCLFLGRLAWTAEFDKGIDALLIKWENDHPFIIGADLKCIHRLTTDLSLLKIGIYFFSRRFDFNLWQVKPLNLCCFYHLPAPQMTGGRSEIPCQFLNASLNPAGAAFADIAPLLYRKSKGLLVCVVSAMTKRAKLRNNFPSVCLFFNTIWGKVLIGKFEDLRLVVSIHT